MPGRTTDVVIEAPAAKLRRLKELREALDTARRAHRLYDTPGVLASHIVSERPNQQTPALDLIDRLLVRVAAGDVAKAMVFMPPQAGKSERVSRRFPLWLLVSDPTLRIAVVSYSAELAVRWGRMIKHDIEANPDLNVELRADSKAAGRWMTRQGGGLYCVGIGGSLTGQAVDVLVIDDPVKDRADAESQTMRDNAWDWWENVAKVRADRTVLIQTRWHTDDLAGRMLTREPGEWEVLSIPAVAETDDDPLDREPGEELRTPRWEPGHYAKLRDSTSPYVWSSLYQQRPTAAEGGIFKRGDWRYWTRGGLNPGDDSMYVLDGVGTFRPDDCARFLTIDLATSVKTSADFTVAAAWAITVSGDLVLLDRRKARVPELDHAEFVEPLRQRWLRRYDVTYVESRMFGTTLVYALGRAGVPVQELDADVDKLTRALPAAGLVRQHKIWLPRDAGWLDDWLDEHADFPNVAHDDQVDVTAYAARVALTHWVPNEMAEVTEARRMAPVDPDYVDLMAAEW